MIVVKDINTYQSHYTRCVATIGKFDGVHRGHQAILNQLKSQRELQHLPALVILIEPHPEEFFARAPDQCPPRLTTIEEKLSLLEESGIDCVYLLEFNQNISQLSAEKYIQEILVDGLGVTVFIVGNDFRFGYQRQGDYALLLQSGRRLGFKVMETASLEIGGHRVSSTYIREQLGKGDFDLVQKLLGRAYGITGLVVRGRQLGKDLGFPTCNIALHRQRIPLHGVFACEVLWNNKILHAAVNIGYRPTISDGGDALLEAHILDFDTDLYGQELTIVFRSKIRDEQKFPSLEQLKDQIARDVSQVRGFFGR
ncbi:MAG: bifunctional riboflavin kinase/FAD synthetase [Pseudohongiellaceae bacterium]